MKQNMRDCSVQALPGLEQMCVAPGTLGKLSALSQTYVGNLHNKTQKHLVLLAANKAQKKIPQPQPLHHHLPALQDLSKPAVDDWLKKLTCACTWSHCFGICSNKAKIFSIQIAHALPVLESNTSRLWGLHGR